MSDDGGDLPPGSDLDTAMESDEEDEQISQPPATPDAHVQVKSTPSKKTTKPKNAPAPSSVPKSAFENFDFKGNEDMHKLWDENQALRVALQKRDDETARLQDAVVTLTEELEQAEQGGSGASGAAKDIAKKNRKLQVSLQRERTRVAKMGEDMKKMQARLDVFEMTSKTGKVAPITPDQVAAAQQAKEQSEKDNSEDWKAKYHNVRTRLSEFRNTVNGLRQELVVTQRALQKEVGEDVPLENVLDVTGKWRGRAQEISMLKTQIMQLKRRLGDGTGRTPSPGLKTPSPRAAASKEAALFDYRSAEIQVRQHEQTIGKLKEELETANNEIGRLKKKCGNLNSRKVVVENSIASLNEKLKLLVQKSDSDDLLISALKEQITKEKDRLARAGMAPSVSEVNMAALQKTPAQVRLERELHLTKEELMRARQAQLEAFHNAAVGWDRLAMEEQNRLLSSDVKQQQELANMYKAKYYESESKLVESVRKIAGLEAKSKSKGKKGTTAGASSTRAKGRGKGKDKAPEEETAGPGPTDTVQSLRAECKAITQQYETALAKKEEEVSALRTSVNRLREAHRDSLEALRQEFAEIQTRLQLPPKFVSVPQKPRGSGYGQRSPARRSKAPQQSMNSLPAQPLPSSLGYRPAGRRGLNSGGSTRGVGAVRGNPGSSGSNAFTNDPSGAQIMRLGSGSFQAGGVANDDAVDDGADGSYEEAVDVPQGISTGPARGGSVVYESEADPQPPEKERDDANNYNDSAPAHTSRRGSARSLAHDLEDAEDTQNGHVEDLPEEQENARDNRPANGAGSRADIVADSSPVASGGDVSKSGSRASVKSSTSRGALAKSFSSQRFSRAEAVALVQAKKQEENQAASANNGVTRSASKSSSVWGEMANPSYSISQSSKGGSGAIKGTDTANVTRSPSKSSVGRGSVGRSTSQHSVASVNRAGSSNSFSGRNDGGVPQSSSKSSLPHSDSRGVAKSTSQASVSSSRGRGVPPPVDEHSAEADAPDTPPSDHNESPRADLEDTDVYENDAPTQQPSKSESRPSVAASRSSSKGSVAASSRNNRSKPNIVASGSVGSVRSRHSNVQDV